MGDKIIVGPINKGLKNDRTAFVIDNDSFPVLMNAYQWRGRVKRKRGTSTLGRLTKVYPTASIGNSGASQWTINTIYSTYVPAVTPESNASIAPGSVVITIQAGPDIVFTDQGDGTLTSPTPGNSGTIIYLTGVIVLTHTAGAGVATVATFSYYPALPVMGLEDLVLDSNDFPESLEFDTVYSYAISTASPYLIHNTNFYKNPPVNLTLLPGYTQKSTDTELVWNGEDYQQFWTINYQGALWATNGVTTPFVKTNVGMQYKPIVTVTVTAGGPPAIVNLQITGHGLSVGDFLFINEVLTTTGINFQTGYVTAVIDANNVTVEFPNATIAANGTGGIAQYLTNNSDITKDCIRWYDGDPTVSDNGWVNFCPPLSRSNFSIADLPLAQYYLCGAKMIAAFKDRLLFIGPVVQTSAADSQVYLKDTVIYSQNGTPYYTASFTGDPSLATTVFHQILVPDNQTATAPAYWEDQTGFGGNVSAGIAQPINTTSSNEDVLILGFSTIQTRLIYTGNDIQPFNFYLINSELGSGSTFSSINMDKGVMTVGERGFIITSQVDAQRFDLEIPDEVFDIKRKDNGTQRVCAQRDFINEWAYFTYPVDTISHKFPTQTLQYNYRDASWGVFRESYTTYGTFRKRTGFTWATIGKVFPTWSVWNVPWNAGSSTLLEPEVIAGNQQGFVMVRDDGTGEGNSLYIKNFSTNQITSPDHCLNSGDAIIISGVLGSVGAQVNGKTFKVYDVAQNTFKIDPIISSGTYTGGGVIKRIYPPYIQTKQFPTFWQMARKTRLGPQQYLFTKTSNSQIQLLIFLSQNSSSAYNEGPIVPEISSVNNSLIYSTVLYTCPESTNLGLTPANINLQTPTASSQQQIWHRKNTSLIGDTVQIGFTISDDQIMQLTDTDQSFPITGATQANPCVLTCTGAFPAGSLLKIQGVEGMTELNFDEISNNYYNVISSNSTTVTIEVDSTAFTAYTSGGTATRVVNHNQFAEIELHSFILDVNPSQLLV